ncbi:glycerate kinase family protein [Enterococcus villorum]|uniref:glycerate kinase family protein n=1 Tax=Enterococcus villorum TaxID=112904 RepID=UPI003F8C0590
MNILAAIDSFKQSATSFELNQAVLNGWTLKNGQKINCPIADGGEGTADAIYHALGGKWREVEGVDLLFRKRSCKYLLTTYEEKQIAVIESASVIGLDLLKQPTDQTIRSASSFGLGELLKDTLSQGVNQIIVTLGGSGCSDGGLGVLQSLGAKLEGYTEGNPLLTTKKIELGQSKEKFKKMQLLVATDVMNPYSNEQGAAYIYGKQKGGTKKTLDFLDERANEVAKQMKQEVGVDLNEIPGSGAAGGIGGALTLVGGKITSGFLLVAKLIGLEKAIKQSDLVITGEGRIDQQTINGKVPYGVARLAQKYQKKVIALCGSREKNLGALEEVLPSVFSIQLGPIELKEALKREETLEKVTLMARNISYLFENNDS